MRRAVLPDTHGSWTPYAAGMELDLEERRRRARRAAWIVGLGLLLVNILIGYPTCSGDKSSEVEKAAESEKGADVQGTATKPAAESSASP